MAMPSTSPSPGFPMLSTDPWSAGTNRDRRRSCERRRYRHSRRHRQWGVDQRGDRPGYHGNAGGGPLSTTWYEPDGVHPDLDTTIVGKTSPGHLGPRPLDLYGSPTGVADPPSMKLTRCHREAPTGAAAISSSRTREGRDGFAALAMTMRLSRRGPVSCESIASRQRHRRDKATGSFTKRDRKSRPDPALGPRASALIRSKGPNAFRCDKPGVAARSHCLHSDP